MCVCVCVCVPSGVQLCVIQWTVARQAPLCVGFSTQEYWSGLPFSTPGYLPNPGTEPTSPALADGFFTTEPPGSPQMTMRIISVMFDSLPAYGL